MTLEALCEDAAQGLAVWSLFSGIGGMDEGLRRAGHRHVLFCEGVSNPGPGADASKVAEYRKGEYRRAVLAERFPSVPVFCDVTSLRVEPAPRDQGDGRVTVSDGAGRVHTVAVPGLLAGGFPCQDLSVAGRRRGLAGERSGLFFEFVRIAELVRPGWLLIENVPGLFSSHGGRDFGVLLGTLADFGYGVAWRILDSRFFGVPQRRRRVFIVGTLADGDPRAAAERAGEVLAVGSRCPGHPAACGEAGPDVASTLGGSVGNGRGHDGNPFDRGGRLSGLSGMGSGGPDDNDAQAGRLVAMNLRGRDEGARPELDEFASLRAAEGGSSRSYVIAHSLTSEGHDASEDGTGRGTPIVAALTERDTNTRLAGTPRAAVRLEPRSVNAVGVRRLTPRECERLQGLPDDWTQLGDTADSKRYSAIGDAVTVNVSEWIGTRIT